MKVLFRIAKEFEIENPIYHYMDEVVIDKTEEFMVKVHDIHDGNEFWIEKRKLELV